MSLLEKSLTVKTSPNPQKQLSKNQQRLLILLSLLAIAGIILGLVTSSPAIIQGLPQLPHYLNLDWAHDSLLIQTLLNLSLMIWLCFSSLFWGGWLIHRCYRKLSGQNWCLTKAIKIFFPPVLLYLKLSCTFFLVIWLYVIAQYPIQFIIVN